MTEKETEHDLLMQFIEQDCYVNPKEKAEYPPVALSFGEKVLKTDKGDLLLPIPLLHAAVPPRAISPKEN